MPERGFQSGPTSSLPLRHTECACHFHSPGILPGILVVADRMEIVSTTRPGWPGYLLADDRFGNLVLAFVRLRSASSKFVCSSQCRGAEVGVAGAVELHR